MNENGKSASTVERDGILASTVERDGILASAMDHIDDQYLAEVAQFDMAYGKMASGKNRFGKRKLVRWVTVVACACLLLVIGGIVWKTKWSSDDPAKNPNTVKDTAKEMAGGTIYVDAHTFLAGREGENAMEIKVSVSEGKNADEAQEEAATPTFITLTWAYESFGGPEEVSRATVRELNRKLKEDGYHLGIKFLPIKTSLTGGTDDVQDYGSIRFRLRYGGSRDAPRLQHRHLPSDPPVLRRVLLGHRGLQQAAQFGGKQVL